MTSHSDKGLCDEERVCATSSNSKWVVFNIALELARPLARALDVPLRHDVLQRTRITEAQTELDAVSRRRNVRGAFALRTGVELPAHVAILDDVMTTGATLAECARVLKRAGVQRVDVWALARAPSHRG
jgi:ComF family protein